MRNLEITNRRLATTAREVVGNREFYYQYETDNSTAVPLQVNFSTQGQDGKVLSGSYTQGGGLVLNGNGITDAEDMNIVNTAVATMMAIVKGEVLAGDESS